jgi:hypothetical protein
MVGRSCHGVTHVDPLRYAPAYLWSTNVGEQNATQGLESGGWLIQHLQSEHRLARGEFESRLFLTLRPEDLEGEIERLCVCQALGERRSTRLVQECSPWAYGSPFWVASLGCRARAREAPHEERAASSGDQ